MTQWEPQALERVETPRQEDHSEQDVEEAWEEESQVDLS
jgi:hypothetical protein